MRQKSPSSKSASVEHIAGEDVVVDRSFDADRLNAIVNHPDVRPFVADASEGVLDLSARVRDPRNVLLMGKHGACLCWPLMPGIWEVHTQVLPEGRGAWALGLVRAGSHWMFTRTDAFEIVTRVPVTHRAATGLTIAAGMRRDFSRPDGCRFQGVVQNIDLFSFRLQDWIIRAHGLEKTGEWFHERLHQEARRLGVKDPAHANDQNHNHYLGATVQMILAGQPGKGVNAYNRWAQMARHPTIELVGLNPTRISMDLGILTVVDGDFTVERP